MEIDIRTCMPSFRAPPSFALYQPRSPKMARCICLCWARSIGPPLGHAALVGLCIMGWITRDITRTPGATLRVVEEETGRPLDRTKVVFAWWSHPHHHAHDRFAHETDSQGGIHVTREGVGERIAPLCMHGVPQHVWELCVSREGVSRCGRRSRRCVGADRSLHPDAAWAVRGHVLRGALRLGGCDGGAFRHCRGGSLGGRTARLTTHATPGLEPAYGDDLDEAPRVHRGIVHG